MLLYDSISRNFSVCFVLKRLVDSFIFPTFPPKLCVSLNIFHKKNPPTLKEKENIYSLKFGQELGGGGDWVPGKNSGVKPKIPFDFKIRKSSLRYMAEIGSYTKRMSKFHRILTKQQHGRLRFFRLVLKLLHVIIP